MPVKFIELSEEAKARAVLSTRSFMMRNFSQDDRNRLTAKLSEMVKNHGYSPTDVRWSFNVNNDSGRLAFYGEVADLISVAKRTLSKRDYRLFKWLHDMFSIRLSIVDNGSSSRNYASMDCYIHLHNHRNLDHFHDMSELVQKIRHVVREDARRTAEQIFSNGLNMVKGMFSEENIHRAIDTFNFDFKEDGTIIAPATRPDFSVLHRG